MKNPPERAKPGFEQLSETLGSPGSVPALNEKFDASAKDEFAMSIDKRVVSPATIVSGSKESKIVGGVGAVTTNAVDVGALDPRLLTKSSMPIDC